MILFTVVLLPLGMVLATMLLVRWAMTAPVVMVEQVSGREALARSARLTDGSSWRLFAIFLVLFVLVWVVMMMALGLGLMVSMSPVYAQVLSNLASLVTYPFAAVLLTVIYYDLRIRNEGFDLELMAAGLGDGAARAAGGTMPSSPPSRQPA
jgi:hypothetical protein